MSSQDIGKAEAPSLWARLIIWLRPNLALLVFFSSLASGALGMLLTTTIFVNDMKHLVADRGKMLEEDAKQLEGLHKDMVDVDRRLNTQKAYVEELRRQRDVQVATLEQRIAVLEAQMRFFADRTTAPPIGARR